jgi:hypothetical protein
MLRRMPFFKLLAIGQAVLLAYRHLRLLDRRDRRRLGELVRRGHRMNAKERDELRRLLGKLEPGAFARAAADSLSPVRLPRRFAGGR